MNYNKYETTRKSELICADTATRDAMLSVAPCLRPVDPHDATLLGSPIGSADGVDSTIRAKKEALEVLGGRLQHLYAHDVLCLLRHVFSLPKMLYTLRPSPCFLSPELELFDQLQRKLLGSITNIDLFVSDRAWTQASLPVWSVGLGIRSVAQLAPSAFLASAAGSSDLSRQLLPPGSEMPSTLNRMRPSESGASVIRKNLHLPQPAHTRRHGTHS